MRFLHAMNDFMHLYQCFCHSVSFIRIEAKNDSLYFQVLKGVKANNDANISYCEYNTNQYFVGYICGVNTNVVGLRIVELFIVVIISLRTAVGLVKGRFTLHDENSRYVGEQQILKSSCTDYLLQMLHTVQ